jgi:hypothetical protein
MIIFWSLYGYSNIMYKNGHFYDELAREYLEISKFSLRYVL